MIYKTEEYLEDRWISKQLVCCPSCGSPYESEMDSSTCPCLEEVIDND